LASALAPLAMFAACDRDNALVDGECAAGYTLVGDACVVELVDSTGGDGASDGLNGDGTLTDGTSTDGTSSDVVSGDATSCDDGLTLCSGTCVDTTIDPFNCGGCGIVCPSLLCSNSLCEGAVPGSMVVIGHDYDISYSAAQAKVLGNALLLSTATSMRVRSYEQYSASAAVLNVKSILNSAAAGASRTITYTIASAPADVTPGMTALNTDVLVVYDQVSAPASTLATIGTGWSATIASFTHVGGIVIVLDGQGGTNPQMPALIQASNILNVTGDTSVAQGTALEVVAPSDAVGLGVVSPYGAGKQSVFFACSEPDTPPVTYVVEDPAGDAGPTQPVVVHKVAP
jgi:hypothetical protein